MATTALADGRSEVTRPLGSTRQFINEHNLAARWGVSTRTVQRRVGEAGILTIGLVDRVPHFDLASVVAYEEASGLFPVTDTRPARSYPSYCIAHWKGGQAKTTTAYYLARRLAMGADGLRVLLRDLDPQRSLTTLITELIWGQSKRGEPEAAPSTQPEADPFGRMFLSRKVAVVPDDGLLPFHPDLEIIDTPPGMLEMLDGIWRSDGVLIPLLPEPQGVQALANMLEVMRNHAPDVPIIGVLPCRYVRGWADQRHYLAAIAAICGSAHVPLLDPVPQSGAVMKLSLRGGLWSQPADYVRSLVEAHRS